MFNEMLKELREFKYEILKKQNKSRTDLEMDNVLLKTIDEVLLAQAMKRDDMSLTGARVKKLYKIIRYSI